MVSQSVATFRPSFQAAQATKPAAIGAKNQAIPEWFHFSERTDGIKERVVIRRIAGVADQEGEGQDSHPVPVIPVITCVLVGPGRKLHRAIHSISAFSLK